MLLVDHQHLIHSLTPHARKALEEAANLCVTHTAYEVTIEHWLHAALALPASDAVFLLRHFGIDPQELQRAVARSFERQRAGAQNYPVFSTLLLELLQDAWTMGSLSLGHSQIRTGGILLAGLKNASRYFRQSYSPVLTSINHETLRRDFSKITVMSGETPVDESGTDQAGKTASGKAAQGSTNRGDIDTLADHPLEKYGIHFTQMARDGKIDPVFCRERELDQMIDILTRRRKNNPIAVGEAGVGKSAIVEGLALRIVHQEVPEHLHNVELWGLDMGALQAGASMKGEFEKRLKAVIEAVKVADPPVILFIDEAHTLIGAGGQAGGSDAANLLKPALARGELRTIAATTWTEYKKYFEKDPALSRRFQLVKLDEPDIEQSRIILRGLLPAYEKAHQVLITDEAIHAAARLSARYISGRQLPDKAIDTLDTACARVSTSLTAPPRALSHARQRIRQCQAEYDMLLRDQQYGLSEENPGVLQAVQVRIDQTQAQITTLEQDWQIEHAAIQAYLQARQQLNETNALANDADGSPNESNAPSTLDSLQTLRQLRADITAIQQRTGGLIHYQVGETEVAEVIADWTGIPVASMTAAEVGRITGLADQIRTLIKGQDQAVELIHRRLLTAKADLRREGLPLGAFLLVGPSGVGKTETALQVAQHLFGSRQFMTVINMSEYQEKHSLSRLIGSPPGYVGYGEGGVLTEAIRQRPYSVVLLDEVEKADPEVLNLFYQAFDKGEMNDGEGRAIDCKNVVFILTSNLGTQIIMDYAEAGGQAIKALEEALFPELAHWFKPALLARMEVVPFLPLNDEVLKAIIQGKWVALQQRLLERHQASLSATAAVYQHIQQHCNRSHNGARIIDSLLEGELLPPLSLELLTRMGQGIPLTHIHVDVADNGFTYHYEPETNTTPPVQPAQPAPTTETPQSVAGDDA